MTGRTTTCAGVRTGPGPVPGRSTAARRSRPWSARTAGRDSIVAAHSLIPEAMRHMMSGLAVLLRPDLPLTRRQQEMIAAVVSVENRCFY